MILSQGTWPAFEDRDRSYWRGLIMEQLHLKPSAVISLPNIMRRVARRVLHLNYFVSGRAVSIAAKEVYERRPTQSDRHHLGRQRSQVRAPI